MRSKTVFALSLGAVSSLLALPGQALADAPPSTLSVGYVAIAAPVPFGPGGLALIAVALGLAALALLRWRGAAARFSIMALCGVGLIGAVAYPRPVRAAGETTATLSLSNNPTLIVLPRQGANTLTVTLDNSTGAAATITTIDVENNGSDDYLNTETGTCDGATVPLHETCTIILSNNAQP